MLAAWAGRVIALALVAVVLASRAGEFGLASGYGIWLVAIAAFMWMSAGQALRSAKVRERLPAHPGALAGPPRHPDPA